MMSNNQLLNSDHLICIGHKSVSLREYIVCFKEGLRVHVGVQYILGQEPKDCKEKTGTDTDIDF